jgi:hypothetical protein
MYRYLSMTGALHPPLSYIAGKMAFLQCSEVCCILRPRLTPRMGIVDGITKTKGSNHLCVKYAVTPSFETASIRAKQTRSNCTTFPSSFFTAGSHTP